MKLFNFIKKTNDNFSQSGQDQFAYNVSGSDAYYLEIGAHHPLINSNTYNLETKCGWKGLSIEYDKSYERYWKACKERKNEVIWDDAFNINYSSIIEQRKFPNKLNYLSCDIEPAENTYAILEKIINSNLSFDYISFEHDKYNIGNKYEELSKQYLLGHNYKIAIKNVYSRNKKYKIYETWFVHNSVNFAEISYEKWKSKYYNKNKFTI